MTIKNVLKNHKGTSKLSLFADDITFYVDLSKTMLELINNFTKAEGHKLKEQKSVAFLYTNN